MPVTPSPSRRALLLGTVAAVSLGGCGVRLEDDAPDIPLLPRRTPVPGEVPLLALLSSLSHESADDSVPQGSAPVRAQVLRASLVELEVPTRELDAAEARVPTWGEGEDVAVYESALRECPPGLVQQVGSMAVGRVLRGPARLWGRDSAAAWSSTGAAVSAAADTRAATWVLTVAAAKASGAEQTRITDLVDDLDDLLARQVSAGEDDGSRAPLGYDLEASTRTPQARRELAATVLDRMAGRLVALLPDLAQDRDAAHEVVTWAARVYRLGRPWGVTVDELPGFGS